MLLKVLQQEKREALQHTVGWRTFLKDVFICSLGAYGGPEAHFGVFTDQLVIKKKYLDETELVELIGLCSILPGPTSTQTIVAAGYKMGGPLLALYTMLVWALPAVAVMTALSFLYSFIAAVGLSQDGLRYIGPMAVGFIITAAVRIGRKVVINGWTFSVMILSAGTAYLVRAPWIFPMILVLGGLVGIAASKERELWNRVRLRPPWRYMAAFVILGLGSLLLSFLWDNRIFQLFESFYRYGYLVFGGGQVVVPVMHTELVQVHQMMTNLNDVFFKFMKCSYELKHFTIVRDKSRSST
jgi:chromate transporter